MFWTLTDILYEAIIWWKSYNYSQKNRFVIKPTNSLFIEVNSAIDLRMNMTLFRLCIMFKLLYQWGGPSTCILSLLFKHFRTIIIHEILQSHEQRKNIHISLRLYKFFSKIMNGGTFFLWEVVTPPHWYANH